MHGCEHRCVNEIGGFRCECNIGFSLREDGRTCQSYCFFICNFSDNFLPIIYPNKSFNFNKLQGEGCFNTSTNISKTFRECAIRLQIAKSVNTKAYVCVRKPNLLLTPFQYFNFLLHLISLLFVMNFIYRYVRWSH